jgi:hypothetical protein
MPNYIDTGGDITARRHKGSATSKAAFERGHSHHANDEARVLDIITEATRSRTRYGVTSKEIAAQMGKPLNAISGRISSLKAQDKIKGIGHRRDGCEVLVAISKQQDLFGGAA